MSQNPLSVPENIFQIESPICFISRCKHVDVQTIIKLNQENTRAYDIKQTNR